MAALLIGNLLRKENEKMVNFELSDEIEKDVCFCHERRKKETKFPWIFEPQTFGFRALIDRTCVAFETSYWPNSPSSPTHSVVLMARGNCVGGSKYRFLIGSQNFSLSYTRDKTDKYLSAGNLFFAILSQEYVISTSRKATSQFLQNYKSY